MKPDAVILSGDLTLNGAYESHSDLAAVLMPLKEAGIAVFVLPGNHDAGGAAYSFFGGSIDEFESVSDGDFPLLYSNFGYDSAISRDSASQSYVAELSPKLRLLFTDVNANGTAGKVRDETAAWAQEQLAAAKECRSYGGFALYSYRSVFTPDSSVSAAVSREISSLKELI